MSRRWPFLVVFVLALSWAAGVRSGEVAYYDLLSTDTVGAHQFIKKHPEWDGRGVVIAVLDTGVDMSAAGLSTNTTGETKVIDARDFSGQGVVHLRKPEKKKENGEPVLKTGKGAVRGYDRLTPAPEEGSLLLGFLEESRFKNSSVSDVNDNGTVNDTFAILMGKVGKDKEAGWAVWVDTDADGQIDDEEMQEEYSKTRKHFFFTAKADQYGNRTMAIALHLSAKRGEVVLHFADGSHGTHVAGIAAGNELFGRKGFNGIAPGARLMSLKIGDNTLSGGSTTTESMKKAMEFAGKWSQEHKTPVVVNVSYGIGTEKEGLADIDRVTDNMLKRYPLLSVATSAGNSGPGLSTVGTPAGANLAFSTGALLTRKNAKNLYGSKIARDVIFYFSSRGGELAKPDGLAPGCAVSSVPAWESWVVMRGTSMASPQAAGCLALLASAAVQAKEKPQFNGGMLARALRNSGRPLPGYSLLDQGAGVVNVPAAWESLKRLASRDFASQIAGYRVTGDCPSCPDGKALTGFFRAGTYLPSRPDSVDFSVSPIFMQETTKEEKERYFETFDLSVEGGDWLEPTSDAIFFNGTGSASVDVFYRPEKLKTPGIHAALIRGTSRETGKGKSGSMFELWNVAIVPYVFDLTNGFSKRFSGESMNPGEVKQYFVRVPEGAASMRIDLAPVEGKYTQARLGLFDPEGRAREVKGPYADSTRKGSASVMIAKEDLLPGIWEVVVLTHYVARAKSFYNLDVGFSGFHYEAPDEFYYELGSSPRASFTLRTLFDQVFEGRGSGGLYGIHRKQEYSSSGDRITFSIEMEKDTALVKLGLAMDRDTYARFTDCAVNVLDSSGRAIEKDGFSRRFVDLQVENPNAGREGVSYRVEIIGGFAERTGEKWSVQVDEYHEKTAYVPAKVWCEAYGYFTLYPNKTYDCEFELQEKPTIAPAGYRYYGELRFKNARTKKVDLKIPLRLKVGE